MAAPTSAHQLALLADHLKLSLLERQRAISLNLEPTKQDHHISRSLSNFQDGLEQLESRQIPDTNPSDLSRLRKQYSDLYVQFHGTTPPTPETKTPNDPALSPDFAAAQSTPSRQPKAVRFRDNADDEDEETKANRAALFSSSQQAPYTDDPAMDQSHLSNQQIHAYHREVLREQDSHLDVLGQSIGRQRMLGIQMGSELDEQNELLDDVERGVDRHSNTLHGAQKRLGTIARKSKENWNWITIAILIIILVLLLAILN